MVVAAHTRRACWVMIIALLIVAPACDPGKFQAPWLRPPDSPYVVNRPAYTDGARPFFISGYAGANYDSFVPGQRPITGMPAPAPVPPAALPAGPPPLAPTGPPAGPPAVTVSEGAWQTD
jgi:hypothetical protein